jgi:hypothetical protein
MNTATERSLNAAFRLKSVAIPTQEPTAKSEREPSTIMAFSTSVEVTPSEPSVEPLYPADDATAQILRAVLSGSIEIAIMPLAEGTIRYSWTRMLTKRPSGSRT